MKNKYIKQKQKKYTIKEARERKRERWDDTQCCIIHLYKLWDTTSCPQHPTLTGPNLFTTRRLRNMQLLYTMNQFEYCPTISHIYCNIT